MSLTSHERTRLAALAALSIPSISSSPNSTSALSNPECPVLARSGELTLGRTSPMLRPLVEQQTPAAIADFIASLDNDALVLAASFTPVKTVADARELAISLHGAQTDKAGRPYVEHLDSVASELNVDLMEIAAHQLPSILQGVEPCGALKAPAAGQSPVHLSAVWGDMWKMMATLSHKAGMAAYLHDTIEDCLVCKNETIGPLMPVDLANRGVDQDVIDAVTLLSHKVRRAPEGLTEKERKAWKQEEYLAYVRDMTSLEGVAKTDRRAIFVKLLAAVVKRADNRSNLSLERSRQMPPRVQERWKADLVPKYQKSVAILDDAIPALLKAWVSQATA
ncbi:hypothetical protein [Gluconobacter potus]|nr:hypothetical protein [Gluconobacter potus]